MNIVSPDFKYSTLAIALLPALYSGALFAQDTTEDNDETEIIEVTGIRSSVISAKETKFAADKIMDGISADDIGALPARSVTETLQRVAGVDRSLPEPGTLSTFPYGAYWALQWAPREDNEFTVSYFLSDEQWQNNQE